MTNRKTTRRALVLSLLSLLLCCSMLVGTTFAWFTDSVTSGNNTIVAGNLDVELYYKNDTVGDWTAVGADSNVFKEDTLWEPGHVEYVALKVVNEGTLALKYDLGVNIAEEIGSVNKDGAPFKLSDYIYFGVVDGELKNESDRAAAVAAAESGATRIGMEYSKAGSLAAGKETVVTMVVFMPESVGNEANYGKGQAIPKVLMSLNLFATQVEAELDSFGKDYDAMAGKTVVTPETAQAAIWAAEEGDVIYLQSGVYGRLVIENADGTPKTGITIEHDKPGNNPTSNPFSVASINLNGSQDVAISGLYFDITAAEKVYSKSGDTGYYASITGAKAGGNVGANSVVITNCKFNNVDAYWEESTINPGNYIPVFFHEQGRPTSRATNITISDNYLEEPAFNFVRLNYMAAGTVVIENNHMIPVYKTTHSTLNFTGNAADLIIRGNAFYNWNPEKAMLGTSWQAGKVKIEVTGNTLGATLTGEGVVLDIKDSYTTENCTVIFEGNTFTRGLAGLNESTVPCNMP